MIKTRKYLYLVVSSYPFESGEPYLHNELIILAQHFKKIYLVIPESQLIKAHTLRYSVPENVSVVELSISLNPLDSIKAAISSFDQIARLEYTFIHKSYNQHVTPFHFKAFTAFRAKASRFRYELGDLLKQHGHSPDETSLYSYWFTFATTGLAFIKAKQPAYNVVTRIHGWDCFFERHVSNYLPFRPFTVQTIDSVVSVSKAGDEYTKTKLALLDKKSVHHSYLGIENLPVPESQVSKKSVLHIVSVAYIEPVKQLNRIADALACVSDVTIHWTHIGDSHSGSTALQEYVSKLLNASQNISFAFLGELSKQKIFEFFRTGNPDLLICTSASEGLPVSMMEAMGHGIGVLSVNVGGVSEIVTHGYNGYLIPADSSALDIAEYLKKWALLQESERFIISTNAYTTYSTKFIATKNYSEFSDKFLQVPARAYQVCSRCVLDTNDYPEITFDKQGVCSVCHIYEDLTLKTVKHGKEGEQALQALIAEIKEAGRNREYDCLIGVSGGVDSTYLTYKAKEWGLRPLVLHVDNGWNTELSVMNIENLVKKLDYDLLTYVINWNEIKDLQLSYLKASVLDIDIPTDNAYAASVFNIANEKNIKHILTGHNTVTEGWLPPTFTHFKYDIINLKAIHKKFGKVPLKTFPYLGVIRAWYLINIRGIKTVSPLNFIDYNKEEVKQLIHEKLGWRDYGGKHYENIFTRFYQGYYLYRKFGIDKRKAHLSTLICSGQITREQVLEQLKQDPYPSHDLYLQDREYVIKKLGLTEAEFEEIISRPNKAHTDYPSILHFYDKLRPINRILKKIRGIK